MTDRQLAVVDGGKPAPTPSQIMEAVIAKGDLGALSAEQRGKYYVEVCRSMGLNPLTKPFDYVVLNGKLTLYPGRGTTDQLRGIHKITPQILSREQTGDLYIVHVRVTAPDGRSDEDLGIVATAGLRGQDLGNAIMKAVTKAKRRATLSLLGLAMPDETEVETIRGARVVPVAAMPEHEIMVDAETGEIMGDAPVQISSDTMKRLHAEMAKRTERDSHEALKDIAATVLGLTCSLKDLTEDEANDLLSEVMALPVLPEKDKPQPMQDVGALFDLLWKELIAAGVPRTGALKARIEEAEGLMERTWDQKDPAGMLATLRAKVAMMPKQGEMIAADDKGDGEAGLDRFTA